MIVDCFIFGLEPELKILEIRLNELDQYVDHFVLVESRKTFTNQDKELFYDNNKHLFEKFNHKITHVILDEFPEDCKTTWDREIYQRNSIETGIKLLEDKLDNDSIILISDLDEIPNLSNQFIENNKYHLFEEGAVIAQRNRLFYYYLNYEYVDNHLNKEFLFCSRILSYKTYKRFNRNPNDIRRTNNFWSPSSQSGWHFSFIGNINNIINKIESFSHSEFNTNEIKDEKRLEDIIKNGNDLFGRGLKFKKIDKETLPKYIQDNWKNFIDKGLVYSPERILMVIESKDFFKAGRNGLYYQDMIDNYYIKGNKKIDLVCCVVVTELNGHLHYPGGYHNLDIVLVYKSEIINQFDCYNYDYIIYMKDSVILWNNFIDKLIEPLKKDYKVSVPSECFEKGNECIWAFRSNAFDLFKNDLETIADGFYENNTMMKNILNNGDKICGVENISMIHYGK